MLREVLFVRDLREPTRCLPLFFVCLFFVMLFYYFPGAPKSPKSKEAIPKKAIPKEAIPKEAINCFLFIKKEAIASFGDFLLFFCETLLCVERLACISKFSGPINIISHEPKRKQTTNPGLSFGLLRGLRCFPVWCTSADESRRQIVVCPPVYAAGLAISPCGAVYRTFP